MSHTLSTWTDKITIMGRTWLKFIKNDVLLTLPTMVHSHAVELIMA